jgi:hypothetical protein
VINDLKIPEIASEAEEPKWWFENRELISDEFQRAAAAGRLKRGGVRRHFAEKGIPFPEPQKTPTPTTTIRLDPDDTSPSSSSTFFSLGVVSRGPGDRSSSLGDRSKDPRLHLRMIANEP